MNSKNAWVAAAFLALVASMIGCGDVCQDAAEICADSDGYTADEDCSGVDECQARCIVDADTCELVADELLAECYAKCT